MIPVRTLFSATVANRSNPRYHQAQNSNDGTRMTSQHLTRESTAETRLFLYKTLNSFPIHLETNVATTLDLGNHNQLCLNVPDYMDAHSHDQH